MRGGQRTGRGEGGALSEEMRQEKREKREKKRVNDGDDDSGRKRHDACEGQTSTR